MNKTKIERWLRKNKYVPAAIIATGTALVIGFLMLTSWLAIPKAIGIHKGSVRAQMSSRIYETVRSVIDENDARLCTQNVYGENGAVSLVTTDSQKVNEICSSVISELNGSFLKDPYVIIEIPLGNAVGISFLSGKGPAIRVRASVYPTFFVDISSNFRDAGINQTLHELILTVKCDAVSVCADDTVDISESYTFCIKQQLIVGTVPFS